MLPFVCLYFNPLVNSSAILVVTCTYGAGLVILTFSTLVTNQNLVVGFILFLILLTIQHMVVTSDAERIAEVRARSGS